jgi:DsbC/DsbD-like thiol-disulfide interchange protein
MKKFYLLLIATLMAASAKSQILKPVKWSYAAKVTSKTTAMVYIKATMENAWHIYALNLQEGGPTKTSITFVPAKDYTLNGKIIAPKPITKYDNTFQMNIGYYEKSVVFQQKVDVKSSNSTIKGTASFMACDAVRCLPEETVSFAIPLKKAI